LAGFCYDLLQSMLSGVNLLTLFLVRSEQTKRRKLLPSNIP
jgi:hypothetical protein